MNNNIEKSSLGYRIRLLRKTLKLSGEKFGDAIGVTKTSVSCWESGKHDISDSIIKLICKTWNVDYFWLTEGADVPMFVELTDDVISDLAFEYNLSDEEEFILREYFNQSDEEREVFQNFLKKIIKKTD